MVKIIVIRFILTKVRVIIAKVINIKIRVNLARSCFPKVKGFFHIRPVPKLFFGR